MPKISVILPVYNAELYISDAISSITSQSFKDFELIIVDDGSSDSSLSIIEKISEKDKRIKIISKHNSGIIDSLNIGINSTDSEYIARMDADDISYTNRFQLQVERFIENKNLAVCGGNVRVFGTNISDKKSHYPLSNIDCKSRLLLSPCFAHPTTMIKRSIMDKKKIQYRIGFELAEDYKIWTELSEHGEFCNIKEPILRYRLHENQTTSAKREPQKIMHIKISQQILKSKGVIIDFDTLRNAIFPREAPSKIQAITSINKLYSKLADNNLSTKYIKLFLAKKTYEVFI